MSRTDSVVTNPFSFSNATDGNLATTVNITNFVRPGLNVRDNIRIQFNGYKIKPTAVKIHGYTDNSSTNIAVISSDIGVNTTSKETSSAYTLPYLIANQGWLEIDSSNISTFYTYLILSSLINGSGTTQWFFNEIEIYGELQSI
jgi:hypothetical protein